MRLSKIGPRQYVRIRLPGIFVSYRRNDNPDATGRIYDRLVAEFGKERVFKDVDSIPLGQDFRGHLNGVVAGCSAMLAIIGPRWTDARNGAGQRRLEDSDDFVRIELEAALARDIPVVPVLVAHAAMPVTSDLPASLASMVFRQSIEVRPDPDFHNDATRLVSALRQMLDPNAPLKDASSGVNAWRGRLLALTIAFAMSTLVAAALAVPALKYLRRVPPPESRVDIVTPATDNQESFALSPDGRQIVFVANSDGASRLWLRPLSKATAQPLAGTEGADGRPFWSPDGRSIGFFANAVLKRLDLTGGQPHTLAPASEIGGGTWSSQGVILFSSSVVGPFSRVAASGGPITQLPLLGKGAVTNLVPVFLPDGEHFLFLKFGQADRGVYLGSLNGSAAVPLTNDSIFMAYLPSGWLLQIRNGATLIAQQLDVANGALVGEPVTVADEVVSVSASASGLVAYRTGGAEKRQLTWVDRSGSAQSTIGAADESIMAPRVSPDGRQIAFSRVTQGKNELWLQEGSRTSRMTFGTGSSGYPVWSPDGSRLAFGTGEGSSAGFYQKLANGAKVQEPLLLSNKIQFLSSWSPDGRYLLYFGFDPGPMADLWVLPTTGDRKPFSYLRSSFNKVWGQFSPDGRWVAYESNESGTSEVYLRQFALPEGAVDRTAAQAGQWQVSTAGGVFPMWRADGKELFYIDPAGMMMAAPITYPGSTIVPGTPVALFQAHVWGGGIDGAQGRQYDVARDGRFLINRVLDTGSAPITLIQNWNPDVNKQ